MILYEFNSNTYCFQFYNSKILTRTNKGIDYKFDLFGDHAMPFNIAKSSNDLTSSINQIDIANYNDININNDSLSTVKIYLQDKIKTINFLSMKQYK